MVDKEGSFEIRKVQLRKYFYHTAYLSRYSERFIIYMAMGMSQITENVVITSSVEMIMICFSKDCVFASFAISYSYYACFILWNLKFPT